MIEVQLRNNAGTILGPGPLATIAKWRHIRRLDQAGEIQFDLPASDLRAQETQSDGNPLLHPKRYAYAYNLLGGAMTNVGAGIVEETQISLSGRAAPIQEASGSDLLGELTRYTCFLSNTPDQGFEIGGNVAAPALILSTFASSWSLSGSNTTMEFYGKFIHETALSALRTIAQETGEHFRLGTGRQIVWLGAAASFADCGVRAEMDIDPIAAENNDDICLITHIARRKESWNLHNTVYPSGAGQGTDRVTLEFMTEWPDGHPFVSDISSIVGAAGTVTVTTASAHGLTTGDDPTITGTVNFDGSISNVIVSSTTIFTYTAGTVASESNVGVVIGPTGRTIGSNYWIIHRDTNSLQNYTSYLAYGYHGKALTFRNISALSNGGADLAAAANALARATYNWMLNHADPARFYDLSVAKLTQIVYPGEKIRVVCRRFITETSDTRGAETRGIWLDIDEDLYILEVTEEHTQNGTEVVGLTVATVDRWPEDGVSAVLDNVQTLVDAATHPQPGLSVDTVSREQPIDEDEDFATRFRLPNYIQRVLGCNLWFRVDQLISPIKTVAGSSTSTEASSASSSSSADPLHFHEVHVSDGTGSMAITANYGAGTISLYAPHGGGSSVEFTTQSQAGGSMSHVHDIPHTHDVEAALTVTYGVFKESLINTYAYSEIDITINGAAPTSSVVAEGSGWYSLDLLADVSSAFNGVPLQEFNEVIFAPNVGGKTANIYAEFEIRSVLQTIG